MSRRYYSSTAVASALTAGVTSGATTFLVGSTSGWPTSYPFTLIVDEDTASEEVVSVTNVSGLTVTVTRGQDGTSAVSHSTGATVKHGVSARDFDEPNLHIEQGDGDNPHGLPDAAWDLETAWQSWTPSWTGLTVGNAVVTSRYRRVGDTIEFWLSFQGGTTASVSGAVRFSLPVAANLSANQIAPFVAQRSDFGGYYVASAYVEGAAPSTVYVLKGSSSTAGALTNLVTADVNTTFSFFTVSGTYEAA